MVSKSAKKVNKVLDGIYKIVNESNLTGVETNALIFILMSSRISANISDHYILIPREDEK